MIKNIFTLTESLSLIKEKLQNLFTNITDLFIQRNRFDQDKTM